MLPPDVVSILPLLAASLYPSLQGQEGLSSLDTDVFSRLSDLENDLEAALTASEPSDAPQASTLLRPEGLDGKRTQGTGSGVDARPFTSAAAIELINALTASERQRRGGEDNEGGWTGAETPGLTHNSGDAAVPSLAAPPPNLGHGSQSDDQDGRGRPMSGACTFTEEDLVQAHKAIEELRKHFPTIAAEAAKSLEQAAETCRGPEGEGDGGEGDGEEGRSPQGWGPGVWSMIIGGTVFTVAICSLCGWVLWRDGMCDECQGKRQKGDRRDVESRGAPAGLGQSGSSVPTDQAPDEAVEVELDSLNYDGNRVSEEYSSADEEHHLLAGDVA